MHNHIWKVHAIRGETYSTIMQNYMYHRIWRRCTECGYRETKRVDGRLIKSEIYNLYEGVEM